MKGHLLELQSYGGKAQKEWNDIPAFVCQNLVENMPRRIQAVLQAKRGFTKY